MLLSPVPQLTEAEPLLLLLTLVAQVKLSVAFTGALLVMVIVLVTLLPPKSKVPAEAALVALNAVADGFEAVPAVSVNSILSSKYLKISPTANSAASSNSNNSSSALKR